MENHDQEISISTVILYEISAYQWFCPKCGVSNFVSLNTESGELLGFCYNCSEKCRAGQIVEKSKAIF